jgi:hypothetical protein
MTDVWDICGRCRIAIARTAITASLVAGVSAPLSAQPPDPPREPDDSFIATAYYGRSFDTFAPDSLAGYPPGTTTTTKNRALFGVDFDYRLRGNKSEGWQLWVAGETLHGVRSADIPCATVEERASELCNPTIGISYATKVLTQQTSVEAFITPRLEFLKLQPNATATWLYATARIGFLAVAKTPTVYKSSHVGLGLRIDGGPFDDSRLEGGWGNNEALSGAAWRRLKVDGLLTFRVDPGEHVKFFVEMFIDNDVRGNNPDAIQTFLGLDVDVRKFFAR